ncbi:ribosomal protein L7/L12 [Enhygromyxa salina]|nr:ribosomal protein L7/L12 [Enhygromyxa salina]
MNERATYALRYLGGTRKINAIKLVRELTSLGLAAAKAIVDAQQVFATGLELERARELVARFEVEADSQLAMIAEATYSIGFDPHHRARASQALVRLRCHGLELGWARGRIGEWTHERGQTFTDLAQRDRAIAAEHARWAARGLAIAEHELEVVAATSARAPVLEQAIRDADDPRDAMQVHADWLQREGDPRGLVAALDLARAQAVSADARDRLDRAFEAALVEHHAHLFGPLGPVHLTGLQWMGGLVIGLDVAADTSAEPPHTGMERLAALLGLPICACLRALRVRPRVDDHTTVLGSCDAALLGGVRELDHGWFHRKPDGFDWSRMPNLERVELVGEISSPFRLAKLRELTMTMWTPELTVEALRHSLLPRLRRLTLIFHGDEEFGPPPLAQLLALPLITSLETLTLRQLDDELWPSELARALVDAAKLRPLARVDVSALAFTAAAYKLLVDAHTCVPNLVLGPAATLERQNRPSG